MSTDEERDAIEVEITDVIDLHSFQPRDMADVARSYLDAAYAAGLRTVRIIHGRGAGGQRNSLRALLERDPRVQRYGDADPGQGGRGATIVHMD